MQSREISARKVTAGFAGWLAATNLLAWAAHTNGWLPFKALLFVSISLLPGVVLLRAMRIRLGTFSARILYGFGLGILVLMLSGLAANQILYAFGATRPLELAGELGTWNVVTALIIVTAAFSNRRPVRIKPPQPFPKTAWLLLGLTLLLPCLAIMGAFRLNNGGNALFAETTLCYAAALIVYVFLLRQRLPDGLLTWFVFVMGLTILLMTSLRGWNIVGHDIEREFRVFTLTNMHGRWNIGLDRDPYNACLSITILPQMFAKILNISGLMVFKIILQIIFAACPAVVFALLRQYASKLAALTGCMLFISYPTFINDSAMLTRQGVAYFFFALALLVITNHALRKRYKLLCLFCSAGVVLAHYSTTYMFVALFAIAVGCKLCFSWWQRWHERQAATTQVRTQAKPTVLSALFVVLLFLMAFAWYGRITATSGGLAITFRESLAKLPQIFSDDNKSADTSAALVFASNTTQSNLYQTYLTNSQQNRLFATPSAAQYVPALISDDMPLTSLGKKALAAHVNPSLVESARQNFAKVLQALALLGVVYTTYRFARKKPGALDVDFICLSLAGLFVLALLVIMPVLSVNYGVLRAFQQTLIFLLLPIMLLLSRLGNYVRAWMATAITTISVVVLFLLFTGFFAQALGGTSPTLSLDNSGIYYALYASPAADMQSFAWLQNHLPKASDVRAANFNRAAMVNPTYPFSNTAGILPSQITAKSFVYLDQSQVQSQKLYTYYQSSPLALSFPLDYYDQSKNEIYSTTSTRVYH